MLRPYKTAQKREFSLRRALHTLITFLILLDLCDAHAASYTILETQPFDNTVFTQGLEIDENTLYLSSGGYKRSFIRKQSASHNLDASPTTYRFPSSFFAEGLTVLNNELFVLTWRERTALVFEKETLKQKRTMRYRGEGWGLANTGELLVMSNGSDTLSFRSPKDFQLIRSVQVTYQGRPLNRINELEYANGSIWANVWFDNAIYRIHPDSGQVLERWDLSELVHSLNLNRRDAVLNGIAYDSKKNAFWVTGKLWPKRFLVRFDSDQKK